MTRPLVAWLVVVGAFAFIGVEMAWEDCKTSTTATGTSTSCGPFIPMVIGAPLIIGGLLGGGFLLGRAYPAKG